MSTGSKVAVPGSPMNTPGAISCKSCGRLL